VKTSFPTALLAASLLAFPAAAADVKPAGGPVMDAMQSALRELQLAEDPRLPLPARLDRLAAFRHTPETAAKLRAVFGTDRPYMIEQRPATPGRLAYRARLQPLHYVSDAGAGIDWDEALLDLDMDKAGQRYDMAGRWNMISGDDGNFRMSAQGMTLSGRQKRNRDGLWFGDMDMRIAGVRAETKREGVVVTMDDLRFISRTVERPKTVDMHFESRIGTVAAAGEKVEDVHVAVRVMNIDKASLAALQAAGQRQRQQAAAMTPEQKLAAMKPMLADFGKAALTRGSAIEIDDISARYRGNKASIRGRIGVAGAVEADLRDLKALARKIVARFEVRVPVAIVRDIAGVIAEKQVSSQAIQQGRAADPQAVAVLRQSITDVAIGKLVGGGYARIEKDVLVSNLEIRNGALTVNGKPVGLPKIGTSAAPAAAAAGSGLPPGALQARRIEDSCHLPDYPEEVVRQDQPLRATFAYRVDIEGNVRDARVAAASGFPAWDQAALAALAQCRYIPALQGGKPIEVQMNWGLVREAGSRHPRDPSLVP
jgi:TonB family protein